MATAPYGVRLLVGAAVTAIEETRKLPQTILMYPMTVVSQVAHLVMKVQQDVADLEALLAYEDATKARAPFQTLLANRITRANAK